MSEQAKQEQESYGITVVTLHTTWGEVVVDVQREYFRATARHNEIWAWLEEHREDADLLGIKTVSCRGEYAVCPWPLPGERQKPLSLPERNATSDTVNEEVLRWYLRPHDTIIAADVGYSVAPHVMHCGVGGDCEAEIWEGQRGFLLTVHVEPQRPPDRDQHFEIMCIYSRSALRSEVFQKLEAAKDRAVELVVAHREGRIRWEPEEDNPLGRNVIVPREEAEP